MSQRLPLLLLLLASCTVPDTGPGDEVMGSFAIVAEELPPPANPADEPFPRCTLKEVPADGGFEFTARLSRNRDGGEAFLVIGGVPRDATFDGQVVTSGYRAPRRYEECACVDTELQETLTVALLSTSQNAAVGNACPPNPLDGGVPEPLPDGGILRPDTTPRGFDAVRACGELVDVVQPSGTDCQCAPCWMRYQVRGVRR